MIVTPPAFAALLDPIEHDRPITFVFRGSQLLIRESDAALPDANALARLPLAPEAMLPVGMWNGSYCRAGWLPKDIAPPDGHAFKGLRALFTRLDESTLAIAGRAFQVADWARTHRFCGACALPMTKAPGERAMKCACGHLAYPRISPAMMVLVKRGDSILLARNVAIPAGGRMSALAGFLEPGESIEEAVRRELFEESGIPTGAVRYVASQPWPFGGSQLMIACIADAEHDRITLDTNELEAAMWVTRDEAVAALAGDPTAPFKAPPPFAIAHSLLKAWVGD